MAAVLIIAMGEYPPFRGGIAVYAKNLAQELAKKHQVTVLAPPAPKTQQGAKNPAVHRPRLAHKLRLANLFGQLYPLLFFLLTRPDFVFITDPWSLKYARTLLAWKNLLPAPPHTFSLLHGTEIEDIAAQKGLTPPEQFLASLAKTDAILVNSAYTARLLRDRFPDVHPDKIRRLYPSVSPAFLNLKPTQNESKQTLKKFNLEKDAYFLSIGRLVRRKGHHLFLDLWPQVVEKHPRLKYALVGAGPEREHLLKQAAALKVSSKFIPTGQVSEKEKKILLQNCLAYIHPSSASTETHQRLEGFGIAVLEAFSQKKTALAFAHGGLPEIIKDKKTGLLVQEGDQKTLLKSTLSLIENKALRDRLQDNAYQDFLTRFSPAAFSQNLASFLPPLPIRPSGRVVGSTLRDLHSSEDKPCLAYVVEWFHPVLGGAGIQAERLARRLEKDFALTILTKKPPALVPPRRRPERAPARRDGQKLASLQRPTGPSPLPPVKRFGPPSPSSRRSRPPDYLAAAHLFAYLLRRRPDLLHVHGSLENNFAAAAILAAKITRTPVLGKPAVSGELERHLESKRYSSIQETLKNLNPLNLARRRLARRLDAYQAISAAIAKELRRLAIPPEKIHLVPNGVETDIFKPVSAKARKDLKKRLDLPQQPILFLTVSRLAAHKGIIDPLLTTWKRRFAARQDLRLLLIGGGEGLTSSVEDQVKAFLKTLPPTPNVSLLGRLQNPLPYYQAADVFILPSENEGLSNSLLEAASTGLVCLASRVSGNTDVIKDGENGYLFDPANPTGLEQKIDQALKERPKWPLLSQRARRVVINRYSIQTAAASLQKIYQTLTAR